MTRPSVIELGDRDVAVLRDLDRVRALTGRQLERLHFVDLAAANSRGSARRRSLGRLVDRGLVTTLPRRVGGERAGSAGLIYVLDSAGHRWLHPMPDHPSDRIRRPWPIGWPFVQHTLDVAELYVRLREQERVGALKLVQFAAEPASWHRAATRTLKPDAWLIYETPDWEQHRWVEVDRGTESLPTLQRKLAQYLIFAHSSAAGPLGVLPLVLLTVPDDGRRVAAQAIVDGLPAPADRMVLVRKFDSVFTEAPRPPP